MEAEIGTVYANDGLEAAFEYIEAKFIPIFQAEPTASARAAAIVASAPTKQDRQTAPLCA